MITIIAVNSNTPHQLPNTSITSDIYPTSKNKEMGSNIRELILPLIDMADKELKESMAASCNLIHQMLFRHIQKTKDNMKNEPPSLSIKTRKEARPITWMYRTVATSVIKIHLKFVIAVVDDILSGLRKALNNHIRSLLSPPIVSSFGDRHMFTNRPHSLGAVKPPEAQDVVNAAIKVLGLDAIDIDLVKDIMTKIQMEKGIFEAENKVNLDLLKRNDDMQTGVLLRDSSNAEEREVEVDIEVVDRPIDKGVSWRPTEKIQRRTYPWWWSSFSNVWGDKGLTFDAMAEIMSKVVVPKAMSARAALIICVHLRNHAKSVLIAEKSSGGDIHEIRNFEDLIEFKLDWMILLTSLILLLDSERDNFETALLNYSDIRLQSETVLPNYSNNDIRFESQVFVLLSNIIESFPPCLYSQEWTESNLYDWPKSKGDTPKALDRLVDRVVVCRSGEKHPILLDMENSSDRTLRHRISMTSIEFLKSILSGVIKQINYGTKWLIQKTGEGHEDTNRSSENSFEVFLRYNLSKSAFLTNPTYETRLLEWRKDHIVMNAFQSLEFQGHQQHRQSLPQWHILDLCIPTSRISTFWRRITMPGTNIFSNAESFLKTETEELRRTLDDTSSKDERENQMLDDTNKILKTFLENNHEYNQNAEQSLFMTCVWKTCADNIVSILASTDF